MCYVRPGPTKPACKCGARLLVVWNGDDGKCLACGRAVGDNVLPSAGGFGGGPASAQAPAVTYRPMNLFGDYRG